MEAYYGPETLGNSYRISDHIDPFPSNSGKRVTIAGAGIIGSSIARQLIMKDPSLEVILLEKDKIPGDHQSGRNSGVVHSGINQKPTSLKAQLAIRGNKLIREFCKKHNVALGEVGTVVVARNLREKKSLGVVYQWGKEAGVPDLQVLNREELLDYEPYAAGDSALRSPTGSIIDSVGFLRAVIEDGTKRGIKVFTGADVKGITSTRKMKTNRGDFDPGYIINAAGLYADKIAHMMRVGLDYEVIPFRGDYMQIKHLKVNSMIYPAPDLRYPFLGVHYTLGIDGIVRAGPTATISFGREAYSKEINIPETIRMGTRYKFWRLLLSREVILLARQNITISFFKREFLKEMQALTTHKIRLEDIEKYRSGIRAQIVDKSGKMVNEFQVLRCEGATHVINAISPGMTSSLAFAEGIERIVMPHLQKS